jgi:DNA replication protein DnaC
MYLKWEDAVLRFKIGKVHQIASIDQFSEGMRDLFAKWIANPNFSLYLSGSAGSGKTYASVALLKGLIEKQEYPWIIYKRSYELDDELLEAVSNRQESFVLEKYHEVPFLFIDDLGVERVNDRVIKQYYSIIDHRLNNLLPTVFTSNILRKDIDKNLGDRIASRLQMAAEIIFPKKDYRKGIN